ncbi:hypothetical protein [Winogradskyella sp.]|uniref:hypothetical protein n=1 Tax=Winogradskyella sp. TaxID=1883156 RepID=UPI0035C79C62
MKHFFPIFLVIAVVGFGESQKKKESKTLRFSDYKFEYPKTWKTQQNTFGVQLLPKETSNSKSRLAFIYLSRSKFKKLKGNSDIISYLKKYAEVPDHHINSKTYSILKIKDNYKFQYKIISEISFVNSGEIFTREELFSVDGKYVSSIMYQGRKDVFYKYHDDAMSIINSIEKR